MMIILRPVYRIICLSFLLLLILFSQQKSYSQAIDSITKFYTTDVHLINETVKIKGTLFTLRDSSIIISNSFKLSDYQNNNYTLQSFEISSIESIKIRDRKRVANGMLIGAISGFVIGGIIGVATAEEENTEGYFAAFNSQKMYGFFMGSLNGAAIGLGAGALLGVIKINFPIHGKYHNYKNQKQKLQKYQIIK